MVGLISDIRLVPDDQMSVVKLITLTSFNHTTLLATMTLFGIMPATELYQRHASSVHAAPPNEDTQRLGGCNFPSTSKEKLLPPCCC